MSICYVFILRALSSFLEDFNTLYFILHIDTIFTLSKQKAICDYLCMS